MEQITLRVQPEVKESLDEEATENGETLSEYVRTLISKRNEDTVDAEEYDRLQDEYEDLQQDNERLKRRVASLIDRNEEHGELVTFAEDERTRLQQRRQAGMLTRLRWFMVGARDDEI